MRQYGGIIISLAVLCVVFAVLNPRFLAFNNFMNIMQQVAVIAVAAYGMTYVILLGEIDLSIGSIIAVSGMVAAQAFAMGFGFVPTVVFTLAAGAIMGGLNGVLSAKLMLPSFIVTVATMGIYRGMVSLPTNGAPEIIDNDAWLAIGSESWLGLPIIIWIVGVLFIFNYILLSKTVFGRRIYLSGGNKEAAIYSGIRVDRIKIIVFMLSGVMAAISGILLSSRLSSAQTNAGMGYELDAIAAVVLGGTSLAGGVGTMVGTILGALIIGVINNGMNMLSVPYFYQLIVKGRGHSGRRLARRALEIHAHVIAVPHMKKIITIGEIVVEIMAVETGNGFKSAIPLIGPFASGAPAIFIDQAARMGQPCGMVSAVGNDDFGALNVERLQRDGVDVSAIGVHPTAATGSAFVRYRPDGNRDFIFNIKHSACSAIGLTPEAERLIETADHLHIMGSALFSEGIVSAIHEATIRIKAKGGTVSFDPNIRKEMLELPGMRQALAHALENTDLFMPSGPEIFLFTRATEEKAAVEELLARGIKAVVIKRGAEGASYFDRSGVFFAPAFKVDEIDPTGAGDSFGAAFVTCWLRDMAPKDALVIANATGARAVGVKGPMEGTSTMAEIDAFLQKYGVPA